MKITLFSCLFSCAPSPSSQTQYQQPLANPGVTVHGIYFHPDYTLENKIQDGLWQLQYSESTDPQLQQLHAPDISFVIRNASSPTVILTLKHESFNLSASYCCFDMLQLTLKRSTIPQVQLWTEHPYHFVHDATQKALLLRQPVPKNKWTPINNPKCSLVFTQI